MCCSSGNLREDCLPHFGRFLQSLGTPWLGSGQLQVASIKQLKVFYVFNAIIPYRYGRLVTPKYADGISAPTRSVTGDELPSARLVSLVAFGEQDVPDPEFTLHNMQWGQIMTHDMSMQAGGTQSSKLISTLLVPKKQLFNL